MQSKREDFGRPLEEFPDRFPAFEASQGAALPNGVLYEQLGYLVRVIVIVAVCCVPCFQIPNSFRVFKDTDPILKLVQL